MYKLDLQDKDVCTRTLPLTLLSNTQKTTKTSSTEDFGWSGRRLFCRNDNLDLDRLLCVGMSCGIHALKARGGRECQGPTFFASGKP